MDAFGTAHRAQASTHGIGKFADVACAGPLLAAELDALGKALKEPARPMVAIVGGSKVSTKLTVLDSLSKIADQRSWAAVSLTPSLPLRATTSVNPCTKQIWLMKPSACWAPAISGSDRRSRSDRVLRNRNGNPEIC